MKTHRRLLLIIYIACPGKSLGFSQSLFLWLLMLPLISSCSGERYYAGPEDTLETSGYYHMQDHIATYYPSGVALDFPGYIVGFEEASRKLITRDEDDVVVNEAVYSAGYTVERLVKAMRYDVPFISHIIRYEGRPYGEGNCALYNIYHNHGTTIVQPCIDDPRNQLPDDETYNASFLRSWDALGILNDHLRTDIASNKYTHLIVAIMGLDTAQEEAIRNYRSIISSIRKDANNAFRPVFIGITWPSFFANRWFDPLWEALAYHPIADRADILGLSWLGVLFNDVIMPLGDRINISVIAHSFGARAATMGICVGSALMRDKKQAESSDIFRKIDNFIGIAPAFSLTRFVNGDFLFYENVYYKNYCPTVKRFIFTASSNDSAFKPVFWSDPVGKHEYMVNYCKEKHEVSVSCVKTASDGTILNFDSSAKISYVDTSSVMKYVMPGVGSAGGGHSDIYRPEIGRLLWNVINDGAE